MDNNKPTDSDINILLNDMGFAKLEYEPEEDDCCDRCDTPGVQLYFGNKDYWTNDGDYLCIDCIRKDKESNDAWLNEMQRKHDLFEQTRSKGSL